MIADLVKSGLFEYERIKAKYNSKEKLFIIFIDSLQYVKENREIIISGWGFCSKTKDKISFCFPSKVLKESSVVFYRFHRKDVNEEYNIPFNEKLGFKLVFKEKDVKNILRIYVKNSEGVEIPFRINLSKYHYKYILKALKNNIKIKGISEAFAQMQYQLRTKEIDNYIYWIQKNERYNVEKIQKEIKEFKENPKISIVIPVYNVDEKWLRKCIQSVVDQFYGNWELCIADDCSTMTDVQRVLKEYADKDERIKLCFRKENGHISEATNSAIRIATGSYIGFMDNDDEIAPNALFECVKAINEHPETDFIYSDEDKIDVNGRRFDPFFKPNWNERLLLGHNYITHFVVVKKELQESVGFLQTKMNGAQDYDFVLRCTEASKRIHHISKILYHWRTIETSTALNPEAKNYAYIAGKLAVEEALERRSVQNIQVGIGENFGTYHLHYTFPQKPTVSLIFKLNQKPKKLINAIERIKSQKANTQIEILCCEESKNADFDAACYPSVRWIANNSNEAVYLNDAAEMATGKYLLFMDANFLPQEDDWLSGYLDECYNVNMGIVGGKLIQNHKIWNAGMGLNEKKELAFIHRGDEAKAIGYYYRLVLPQEVYAVTDIGLLIPTTLFRKIGGFDEKLKNVYMAVDLCIRVREAGRKIIWTPYAELMGMGNNQSMKDMMFRDVFYQKWSDRKIEDPYTNRFLFGSNRGI